MIAINTDGTCFHTPLYYANLCMICSYIVEIAIATATLTMLQCCTHSMVLPKAPSMKTMSPNKVYGKHASINMVLYPILVNWQQTSYLPNRVTIHNLMTIHCVDGVRCIKLTKQLMLRMVPIYNKNPCAWLLWHWSSRGQLTLCNPRGR